jgi:ribA/ribD-fused uncharacterized protein
MRVAANQPSKVIDQFVDEYKFLSSFYPAPIEVGGILYPTVEHAFQALKYVNVNVKAQNQWRMSVSLIDLPGLAKKAGRGCQLRPGWDDGLADKIMFRLVLRKFKSCLYLKRRLLATEDAELIEGNWWGDTTWGVNIKTGRGQNKLGKILMRVRRILKRGTH